MNQPIKREQVLKEVTPSNKPDKQTCITIINEVLKKIRDIEKKLDNGDK